MAFASIRSERFAVFTENLVAFFEKLCDYAIDILEVIIYNIFITRGFLQLTERGVTTWEQKMIFVDRLGSSIYNNGIELPDLVF